MEYYTAHAHPTMSMVILNNQGKRSNAAKDMWSVFCVLKVFS
jgi:hypothetical protein